MENDKSVAFLDDATKEELAKVQALLTSAGDLNQLIMRSMVIGLRLCLFQWLACNPADEVEFLLTNFGDDESLPERLDMVRNRNLKEEHARLDSCLKVWVGMFIGPKVIGLLGESESVGLGESAAAVFLHTLKVLQAEGLDPHELMGETGDMAPRIKLAKKVGVLLLSVLVSALAMPESYVAEVVKVWRASQRYDASATSMEEDLNV